MHDKTLYLRQLRLRVYPDPALREVAKLVKNITEEISDLAERMIEIMLEAEGIGLAAPQVGVGLRMFVMSVTDSKEDAEVFINPELSNFEGTAEVEEGCLSLPGVRAKVRRPAACIVKAIDLDGNEFVMDAVELAGTAVQHETDHLDGKLFIDKINVLGRLSCRKMIKQLERDYKER